MYRQFAVKMAVFVWAVHRNPLTLAVWCGTPNRISAWWNVLTAAAAAPSPRPANSSACWPKRWRGFSGCWMAIPWPTYYRANGYRKWRSYYALGPGLKPRRSNLHCRLTSDNKPSTKQRVTRLAPKLQTAGGSCQSPTTLNEDSNENIIALESFGRWLAEYQCQCRRDF